MANYQGLGHALSQLKSWVGSLRLFGLENKQPGRRQVRIAAFFQGPLVRVMQRRDHLMQMSYISRALPQGNSDVLRRGLEQHLNFYSSNPKTDPSLLLSAKAFAKKWAEDLQVYRGGLLPPPLPRTGLKFSESACVDATRSAGGLALKYAEQFWNPNDAVGTASCGLRAIRQESSINSVMSQIRDLRNSSNLITSRLNTPLDFEVKEYVHNPDLVPRSGPQADWLDFGAVRDRSVLEATKDQFLRKQKAGSADFDEKVDFSHEYTPALEESLKSSALLQRALEEFYAHNHGMDDKHVVVGLAERGFKSRVVTKSPWYMVLLGHQVREYLWTLLKRDPRITSVIAGDHRKAVEQVFKDIAPHTGWQVVSSDLTAASDTLPLDLIRALVEGLEDAIPLPVWMIDVLRACTGSLRLQYQIRAPQSSARRKHRKLVKKEAARLEKSKAAEPIASVPEGSDTGMLKAPPKNQYRAKTNPKVLKPVLRERTLENTQRGILMGLPTTWFMLCLVHLFWIDEATKATKSLFGKKLLSQRAAVCGDDLVAHWPQKTVNAYHKALEASGAVISQSKHYISQNGGCFTEELFYTRVRKVDTARFNQRYLAKGVIRQEREHKQTQKQLLDPFHMYTDEVTRSGGYKQIAKKVRSTDQSSQTVGCVGVKWLDAIPLRGLVRPRRIPGEEQLQPLWAVIGPAAYAIVAGDKRRQRRVHRVLDVLHPGLADWARDKGFIPYLPRIFGGFGLPGKTLTLQDVPKSVAERVRGMLYRANPIRLIRFNRPWAMTAASKKREEALMHFDQKTQIQELESRLIDGDPNKMQLKEAKGPKVAKPVFAVCRSHKHAPHGYVKVGNVFDVEETYVQSIARQLYCAMNPEWLMTGDEDDMERKQLFNGRSKRPAKKGGNRNGFSLLKPHEVAARIKSNLFQMPVAQQAQRHTTGHGKRMQGNPSSQNVDIPGSSSLGQEQRVTNVTTRGAPWAKLEARVQEIKEKITVCTLPDNTCAVKVPRDMETATLCRLGWPVPHTWLELAGAKRFQKWSKIFARREIEEMISAAENSAKV